VYASPDNAPSYCCTRVRIQYARQYIDTTAAARDSAEIITNAYIYIIYIYILYSVIIIYLLRENPFGFGCIDNVSPGCIFWYDFMILSFLFIPAGSTTKFNELVWGFIILFCLILKCLNVCISRGKRMSYIMHILIVYLFRNAFPQKCRCRYNIVQCTQSAYLYGVRC